MNKKILNQLIDMVFVNETIDQKKAYSIAEQLNRKQLKTFVKGLKKKIVETTVHVTVAKNDAEKYKQQVQELFPNKRIVFTVDESLLLGFKLQQNDVIFDMSLKKTLDDMLAFTNENI